MKRLTVGLLGAIVIGAGFFFWPALAPHDTDTQVDGKELEKNGNLTLVEVALPRSFSDNALIGKRAFDANCAACHGINAAGQGGVAPPLVHVIYEPGHHGDESFQRAVALGVRVHHWSFGNMPAIEGLTRADVAMITSYIRELQRANGIN